MASEYRVDNEIAVPFATGRAAGWEAPLRYILSVLLVMSAGLLGVVTANKRFAPEMYTAQGPVNIARELAKDRYFAVFDLNVNIREIRDAQIAMSREPADVVLLGASQWQEAHSELLPHLNLFNAHVHRDYYEDILAVSEMLVRHDRLPRTMVIAIRDQLFAPIENRADHLWLPGIPYYRAMADRLGIQAHGHLETLPVQRWHELISLPMLFNNVTRWYKADEYPQASDRRYFKTLDTLVPDGSIVWSREHRALFTERRAADMARSMAASVSARPPSVDPAGVAAVDALLTFLKAKGVEVILAQPPFNPAFFDRVRGTAYMHGLQRIDDLTRELADKHGLRTIGSFDPAVVGCTEDMYIDAEHSNPQCLAKIFEQLSPGKERAPADAVVSQATPPVRDIDEPKSAGRLRTATTSDDLARQLAAIQQNSLDRAEHPDGDPVREAAPAGDAHVRASIVASLDTPRPTNVPGDDLALQMRAIESNARHQLEAARERIAPIEPASSGSLAVADAATPVAREQIAGAVVGARSASMAPERKAVSVVSDRGAREHHLAMPKRRVARRSEEGGRPRTVVMNRQQASVWPGDATEIRRTVVAAERAPARTMVWPGDRVRVGRSGSPLLIETR